VSSWTGVFIDNALTRKIVHDICKPRVQSNSYFFSYDRESHVRFPGMTTAGFRVACVRSAALEHVDNIQGQLEPWLVGHCVSDMAPALGSVFPDANHPLSTKDAWKAAVSSSVSL
jgi:hypothetical protein